MPGTVKIDQRMPDHRPEPAAYRAAAAVGREFRNAFAVDHARAVKLDVNRIDHFLRIGLGLCKVPRDALHIRAMLLVKFPPGALVAVSACDRKMKVVCLDLFKEFSDRGGRRLRVRAILQKAVEGLSQ